MGYSLWGYRRVGHNLTAKEQQQSLYVMGWLYLFLNVTCRLIPDTAVLEMGMK